MRGGAAPLPRTWRGHIRWRLAVPILGLSLLFGAIGSTAVTHGAELARGMEAGRAMLAGAGAWLSTIAAQAFTMEWTHARVP